MNLDIYGGAFRCLLRLRENAGNPVMSDRQFSSKIPAGMGEGVSPESWNSQAIAEMAAALGLGGDVNLSEDYAEVLDDHRAGRALLVRMNGAGLALHSHGEFDFRVTVLAEMDEKTFSVWCPMRNGSWDLFAGIERSRWEALNAAGVRVSENGARTAA